MLNNILFAEPARDVSATRLFRSTLRFDFTLLGYFMYGVACLPDGICLVCIESEAKQHVAMIDPGNMTIRKFHEFHENSDITGILHSSGVVYFLQMNGTLVERPLSLLGKSLRSHKVCAEGLTNGCVLEKDRLLLTNAAQGKVFTYHLLHKRKKVKIKDLNAPVSVEVGTLNGHKVYAVCESGSHRVCLYSSLWNLLYTIGSLGDAVGQLSYPESAIFTPWGTILVADTDNNRVCEFSPEGSFQNTVLSARDIINPVSLSYSHPYLWVANCNGQLKAFRMFAT